VKAKESLDSLTKGGIIAFGEVFNGKIHHASLEILTPLKEVAEKLGKALILLCLSGSREEVESIKEVKECIADEVWIVSSPELKYLRDDLYAEVISKVISVCAPEGVFFPATSTGTAIAPRVAGVLSLGLCAHVSSIEVEDGKIVMLRPTFGENIIAKLSSTVKPVMATIAVGMFPIKRADKGLEIKEVDVPGVSWQSKIRLKRFMPAKREISRLKDAKVVVAGGRGLKSKENFQKLFKLAELLKGEVGATRPVCYEGWVEENRMIGVSGISVHPKVYIGFGISGALQHTLGMENSEFIIAVNTDKEAPLVKMANLALIGDASKVLDEVIRLLSEEEA